MFPFDQIESYGTSVHVAVITSFVAAGLWMLFMGWDLRGFLPNEVCCRGFTRECIRFIPVIALLFVFLFAYFEYLTEKSHDGDALIRVDLVFTIPLLFLSAFLSSVLVLILIGWRIKNLILHKMDQQSNTTEPVIVELHPMEDEIREDTYDQSGRLILMEHGNVTETPK